MKTSSKVVEKNIFIVAVYLLFALFIQAALKLITNRRDYYYKKREKY